jgi:hypothetical protein
MDRMDHESYMNGAGKMNNRPRARLATPPPPPGQYERVLSLTTEIAALELQMNEKMEELNRLLRSIDDGSLPSLLVDLLKRSVPVSNDALTTVPAAFMTPTLEEFGTLSFPVPIEIHAPKPLYSNVTFESRIVELMADGRERRAATIIKALKAKSRKSSVYHALKRLVADGVLVKPAYAHYRKS